MKVLLYEDLDAYNSALAAYTQRLQPMQTVLNAYAALGFPTVPTAAELEELQDSPRRFLVKMLTNRQPLIILGGLTTTPDKFWDIMDKPAGAEEFVALATETFAGDGMAYMSNRIDVTAVELVNGQVVLKQATKDRMKESSRFYATAQSQLDEWAQLQVIVAALQTICQMPGRASSFNAPEYLRKVLKREGNAASGNPVEADVNRFLSGR